MSYNWQSNTNVGGDELKPLLDPINSGALNMTGTYSCVNSIDEFDQVELNIFPNPASHTVRIESNEQNYVVELFSIEGKLIHNKVVEKSTGLNLDVSALKPGVYFLNFIFQSGTISRKLAIE